MYSDFFLPYDMYLADTVGPLESLVISLIQFRLALYQNDKQTEHFRDGKWWYYETVKKMTEDIRPYSKSAIEKALKNLRNQGVITTAHYGGRFDRTNWYTVDTEKLDELVYTKHPKLLELHKHKNVIIKNNKSESLDTVKFTESDTVKSTESYIYNNNIHKNTKNTLKRGASVSLTFPEIPEEDQDKCRELVLKLSDKLNEAYPVKDGIATGLKAICNILQYCTSYEELDTYVGGMWYAIQIKLTEYRLDTRNRDPETEKINFKYFPKLEKFVTENLTNPFLGYFMDGIEVYRCNKQSTKEGDADAG